MSPAPSDHHCEEEVWRVRVREQKSRREDEWNQVSRLEDVITITQVYCYVMVIRYFFLASLVPRVSTSPERTSK